MKKELGCFCETIKQEMKGEFGNFKEEVNQKLKLIMWRNK